MYARPRDVGGIFLPESMEVNREMDLFGKWTKPGRLDVTPTITPGFDGSGPGVTLRSSKLEATIWQLGLLVQTATEIRVAAILKF